MKQMYEDRSRVDKIKFNKLKGFTLPANVVAQSRLSKSPIEKRFDKMYQNKFYGRANARLRYIDQQTKEVILEVRKDLKAQDGAEEGVTSCHSQPLFNTKPAEKPENIDQYFAMLEKNQNGGVSPIKR